MLTVPPLYVFFFKISFSKNLTAILKCLDVAGFSGLSDGKIEDLHMLCLLCFTKERTNERTVKHKMAATGKENEALPRRVESSFKVSDTHPIWGKYYEHYWIRNCRLAACFYLSEAVQCWLHRLQSKH